jgi:hypothetical protein
MPYRDDPGATDRWYEVLCGAVAVAKRQDALVDRSLEFLHVSVTEKSAPRDELDASFREVRAALRQVEEQLVVARRAAESLDEGDPKVRAQLYEIEALHKTMSGILAAAEERFG